MAFDWTGLLGSAQKSHNNSLYAALLGAKGAGDTKAAQGFLNDKQMNPLTGDFGQGNRPGFQSSNPNYVSPKGWGDFNTPTGGGGGGVGGGGDIDPLSTPEGNKAALGAFLNSDWTHLYPTIGYDAAGDVSTAGDALQSALKAGLARKQITQSGFDAGMKNYGTDVTNATNFANTFLKGREANLDTQLVDVVKAAKASLKADPQNFHWNDYLEQINDTSATEKGALGSSLQSALASNGFFSIPMAMTSAGKAMGAYNAPSSDDLLKALVSQTKGGGGSRGVGNQGAF
jgi:hypothetical protein